MSPESKAESIRSVLALLGASDNPMNVTINSVMEKLKARGIAVSYPQVYQEIKKPKKENKMSMPAVTSSAVGEQFLERFVKFGKETQKKRHHIRKAFAKLRSYMKDGTVTSLDEMERFLEKYQEIDGVSPKRAKKATAE